VLRVGEPRYALAALLRLFDRPVRVEPGIHGSAVIHPSAHVAEGAAIGAFVQVGAQARIGARTALLSHVSIGAEARIGADCLLHPGVRIGDRVLVGDRVIIHHNASLGSDGFGFAAPELAVRNPSAPRRPIERINSIGTVVVGDDVEIGASTTIDRGTLGETRLGRGTKIDNLVQIGHNTIVGEDCLICGNVGISGSCRVGNRVVIAGGAGIADHLSLGDDCVVMAAAAVGSDVPARTAVVGMPAIARQDFFQQYKSLRRLKRTLDEVAALRELRERVEALEAERGTDRTR
jgi:UDP-3-O-[3-hydroxymyristoyl] glucosamine N-acyltransferase